MLDSIRGRAAAAPGAAALLAPGRDALSWAELISRTGSIAASLRTLGFGEGDVVAVAIDDHADFIPCFLGVSGVSACAPLNPSLTGDEYRFFLNDLGAAALVAGDTGTPAASVAAELGIAVLAARKLPGAPAWPAAVEAIGTLSSRRPQSGAGSALLLHTSATTGRPKLVPHTPDSLHAAVAQAANALRLAPEDRFLSMMPLFHLQGLVSVLAQLYAGGSVVCASRFEEAAFGGWLEAFQPTWYTAGPALHRAILEVAQRRPGLLGRAPLRFVRSIGAPLPVELIEALERILPGPVIEGYGLTETGVVTNNPLPPGKRKPGSVGLSAGPEVMLLDESGRPAPPGCEGEILVRGASVMPGYRNTPGGDREAFLDGWLRTGDLGRFDAEGYLYITGRIKEIINRGGEKIQPGEVDAALLAHPAVADAAAFGIPHPRLGEDVAAAVVVREGGAADERELRRFMAGRLAAFKIPRRILFLEKIPKGATGKPRRGELSEQAAALSAAGRLELLKPPRTPVEKRLAEIWSALLGVEPIGVDEDFFSLGGDSLAATTMLTRLPEQFGVGRAVLDRADFFEEPTIANLARIIEEPAAAPALPEDSPLIALQPAGCRRPFFCAPGAGLDAYYFRRLSQRLGAEQPFFVFRLPVMDRGVFTVEEVAARFAAAIRQVQPGGPYALGGHCFGGIVAFEAGRQLAERGETVELLALFDVPAPGYPKVLPHWRRYARQARLALAGLRTGRLPFTARDLAAHAALLAGLFRKRLKARAERTLAQGGLAAILPAEPDPAAANERAGRNYVPSAVPFRVVHFIAASRDTSTVVLEDARLGWRDFARGGFTVHRIPGGHDSMFVEPYAGELAARLKAELS